MAYKSATRHRGSTGSHAGNMTVGEYIGKAVPKFGNPAWARTADEISHSIKAAKRKHIECRFKKTEPYLRFVRSNEQATYRLNGYGYAVDLKTGNMGYANHAHEALHALYAGVAYAKEMSKLIVEAYLSGGSTKK